MTQAQLFATIIIGYVAVSCASAATLEVGDGKVYTSIDKAVAAAKAGDEVLLFPN